MPIARLRTRCLPLSAVLLLTAGGLSAAAAAAPGHHARRLRAAPAGAGGLSGLSVVPQPANPRVGQPVTLLAAGATPPGADFRWQIEGAPLSTLDSGSVSRVRTVFTAPGPHLIRLQVQAGPRAGRVVLVVNVGPRSPAAPAHAPALARRSRHATGGQGARVGRVPRASRRGPSRGQATFHLGRRSAHATAGDPSVSIVDFAFHPGTTTIHAGDTITWTNTGNAPHSATASNNSWNTGILQTGQSGSHTFSQPGTYSYYCIVHPFMKGTIVVLAASGTPSTPASGTTSTPTTPSSTSAPSSGSPTATTPTTGATTPSDSSATLPFTGMNLGTALLAAVLLLGSGIALRRLSRRA